MIDYIFNRPLIESSEMRQRSHLTFLLVIHFLTASSNFINEFVQIDFIVNIWKFVYPVVDKKFVRRHISYLT